MKCEWYGTSTILAVICVLSFVIVLGQQRSSIDLSALFGDWKGESICVGDNPSCHDEVVVYHISKSSAAPEKLTLAADKIVNGKPEPMGTLDFKYDRDRATLIGEFQNARYHGLWEYTIKDNVMEGTLVLLPDKTIVRRAKVKKVETIETETANMMHANGSFEVKLTPEPGAVEDKNIGRMLIEKQWHGDLEGASKGEMLTGGDVTKGSAGYVAIEKVTGTLGGRKGTFILQHSATMTRGQGNLTIIVVPDSGTEQLEGLTGKMTIKIENGKHFYDFEYAVVH